MSVRFRVVLAVGHFGLNLGWVVSLYFGVSFWPDIPPTPPPIIYNINKKAHIYYFFFMTSHTSLCSAAVSKESHTAEKDDDTDPNPFN